MAKLGRSTYTLTDLTETLPVSLVLKSNLDKNIQIKNGSRYEPDFENTQEGNSKGVIITPSLFLGQENLNIHENEKYVKPNNRKTGFLYYEIGSTTYKYGDSTSGIYVDIQGRLHIEQNLTENITIEAYIQNFIYESHNYEVELVQAINPINLLLLEDNDNFYAVIECEGGREHFDDKNHYPIKMMACLYKGNSPINKNGEVFDTKNYGYSWDRLGDGDTIADSMEPTLTVERKKILNRDLYTCIITDKNTGLTYTAQQFIYDFSDQYYCQLINNKPLLLSEANTEVQITANVWDRDKQIEDMTKDGKKIYNLSYQWIAIDSNGQEIDLVGHKEGEDYGFTTEKIFIVKTSDAKIPKKDSFTIYCKVFNTDSSSTYPIAGNTISFQYIPVYSVRIKPKDIFVDTSNSGAYLGNKEGVYTFEFQLLDKDGQIIDYDNTDANIEKAPAGKDYSSIDGTEINFIQENTKKKWSFTGKIKLNPRHENSLWNIDESSRLYEFTYVYFGQQFTDEVNIIKNKNGENGEQGFSGYTIDLSNEFHGFAGGEGTADPDQKTSCFISAYFGSEKQNIDTIKIGSVFIFERSAETGQNRITEEYDYKFGENNSHLFLSAAEKEDKTIEIIIRTNRSTVDSEKALFLKDIESLVFNIGIKDTKNTILEFPKIFNYTINYNGKSYSLVSDTNTIVYSKENLGTYEPSSFNVSATVREVNGAASTYSKGIIIYSFDSKKWKYLGSSGVISGYQNLDNIYIRLYSSLAKNYITSSNINITEAAPYLLDMETIPIVTSMDGYEIGGENLLKYSKLFLLDNKDKWFKSDTSKLSVLDDEEDSIEEKNLVFQVSGIGETAGNPWYNFKSPKFRLKKEYINKDFCFSCYVFLEKKTAENSITPLDENGFSFLVSAYDDYETAIRGAYQSFAKIYLNSPGSAITNETWEAGKWIKIYKVFNLNNSFFTHTENGTNEPTKLEKCSYLNITFALAKNGYLKIKLPKLELGNVPSAWTPAPNDIFYSEVGNNNENILDLIANNSSNINDINQSFNITVTDINGTQSDFTSYQEFVNYVQTQTGQIKNLTELTGEHTKTLSGVNTQIEQIVLDNGDLKKRTAYIATGYKDEINKKTPFLELGVKDATDESKNHLRMELTNTLLSFYENSNDEEPIAYFGGNALSITKGRFTKELYIGTDDNNYLVIKTTPNGIAFMWSKEKFEGGIK